MTNDKNAEIELVLKQLIKHPEEAVDRHQLERELKMDSTELSMILSKMVTNGYLRAIDRTENGIGTLLFSLTPSGKEKAVSFSRTS